MKKSIIICVTCIAVTGLYVEAQNKTTIVTTQSYVVTPPPPAPPIPPIAPVPPSTDEIDQLVPPPLPPAPPVPPLPPVPAIDYSIDRPEYSVIEIINSNGYEVSVHKIKGTDMVFLEKDGKTQKIKLTTWNANRKYYEKKYGQLPPPPPLVPAVEEVSFSAPVIQKDAQ